MDKNALKDKLMEHINKAVKGKGDIDGQSEEEWYKETREMLDKLAYSESETQKSNSDEEEDKEPEDKEDKGELKENKCKKNADDDKGEKKENADNEEEEDEEEDEKHDKKDNRKSNSKDSDDLERLHNSYEDAHPKSEYVNQATRIELGKILF